jgi:hypothetical protein
MPEAVVTGMVVLASLTMAVGCGGTPGLVPVEGNFALGCNRRRHVPVRITPTSAACVETQHAQAQVERLIKRHPRDNPCPQGGGVIVNLRAGSVACARPRR